MTSQLKKAAAVAVAFLSFVALPTAAHAQRTGLVVARTAVEGNVRRTSESILAETGIKAGDTINIRDVQRAVRKLWASGAYKNIEPRVSEAEQPNHVALTWVVDEQPVIGQIDIVGLETLREGQILDSAGLRIGSLRPSRVAAAEAYVRQMLGAKGYQLRSISHRLEPIPGSKTGDQRLVIEVAEGRRVAIADIEFEGNDVYSDDDLRGVLATKPEGFFWFRTGQYDEEKVRADLRELLPSHYGRSGYLDFSVIGDSL